MSRFNGAMLTMLMFAFCMTTMYGCSVGVVYSNSQKNAAKKEAELPAGYKLANKPNPNAISVYYTRYYDTAILWAFVDETGKLWQVEENACYSKDATAERARHHYNSTCSWNIISTPITNDSPPIPRIFKEILVEKN